MLLLFGIIKKIFKIHTQERKVATYTSTSLKSRFCLFVTMAHGINCTQFLGKPKLRMAKKAYQDGHTQVRRTLNRARGHATQTCSLWRVSSHSSKTERSQTFPAMKRKESTQRHLLNQGQRKPPSHPTPSLPAGRAKSPSAAPRPCSVCRLHGSGLGGSSALYLWLLYSRAIPFHRMGKVTTFAMKEKEKERATARDNS